MSQITIRETGPYEDRRFSIEVNGTSHGPYSLDQRNDLVRDTKLFLERARPKMVRLEVDGGIKPHFAMALIDAGVTVPDPCDEEVPYDPDLDEATLVAMAAETLLNGELDELPGEIDGKPVIRVTYDEGVMSFVVGDPIEDVAAYFEDITAAILDAKEIVARHKADGHAVILVVSDIAQAFQDQVRKDSH